MSVMARQAAACLQDSQLLLLVVLCHSAWSLGSGTANARFSGVSRGSNLIYR